VASECGLGCGSGPRFQFRLRPRTLPCYTSSVPTKVDESLRRAMEAHADDPERVELLRRAREFKASWVELAEALTRVRESRTYETWGYDTFEAYVTKELHIKRETAEKLTASFRFLSHHAPDVLERDGVRAPIPTYQAVDFLSRAYETDCPKELKAEIRRAVLDEGASAAQVQRRFKEALFPPTDESRMHKVREGLLSAARRLAHLLAEPHGLPRDVVEDLEADLGRLIRSIETSRADGSGAPKGAKTPPPF
jgi:hypothetical protein